MVSIGFAASVLRTTGQETNAFLHRRLDDVEDRRRRCGERSSWRGETAVNWNWHV